jgi:hypothetical protein
VRIVTVAVLALVGPKLNPDHREDRREAENGTNCPETLQPRAIVYRSHTIR